MFAEVYDSNGKYVYSKLIEKTNATNGWERRSVTFDLPAGATLKVNMGFGPDAYGTVWFDDVQLEKAITQAPLILLKIPRLTTALRLGKISAAAQAP